MIDVDTLSNDERRALAQTLQLHEPWTLWVKANDSKWIIKDMHRIISIATVSDLWGTLNNIPTTWCATVNLFLMRGETLPLHEKNLDLFPRGKAGTWSVVIRKQAWHSILSRICAAVVSESMFSDDARGVCIVPVSNQHTICKIWVSAQLHTDGKALSDLFSFPSMSARFKPFV